MVMVTISTNADYIADLVKRMKKHGISQAALAREMKPPATPSQATRWFTKNPDRQVTPGVPTMLRIEEAMERLINRRRAR